MRFLVTLPRSSVEGGDGVLNLANLGTAQERYYIDSSASGFEDYDLRQRRRSRPMEGPRVGLLDPTGAARAYVLPCP